MVSAKDLRFLDCKFDYIGLTIKVIVHQSLVHNLIPFNRMKICLNRFILLFFLLLLPAQGEMENLKYA